MERLKRLLLMMIMATLITNTYVCAYTGEMDTNDNILISDSVASGNGKVDITKDIRDYKLYYQWIEINNDTYKQIRRLKDEQQIIQYFNMYLATEENEYYDYYESLQESYKSLYGAYLEDCSDQKVDANISQIKALLPDYTNKWTESTDNRFNMDLSTFSGTRDYVVWIKLEKIDGTKIYDSEVFELTGTKQEFSSSASQDNIFISEVITNGNGIIEISRDVQNYKLYYQWIEIDSNKYNQIRRLKDELQIIQYFNMFDTTGEDEYYDSYISAQEGYKELYGAYLEDCSEQKIDENESQIIGLLPNYTNNWTQTTDNKFQKDLSTFSGTKNYVLWVQLERQDGTKIYDSEIFELTGTKQQEPSSGSQDNIFISEIITNGKGIIEISRDIQNYKLYYQWIEMNSETYNRARKLKDELQIIQYFNMYDSTGEEEYYNYYYSAQQTYKNLYGVYVEDCSDSRIDQILAEIETLIPRYRENWTQTTNNTFEIDTSTFTGTKYYTLWVKLEKQDGTTEYNSEIFGLTGTKKEDPDVSNKMDPQDNIFISEILTNGKGTIEISRDVKNYRLYYQWVEMDRNVYNQIRKLKDELQIIQYFNMYDATGEDEYYDYYISAQEGYKDLYGAYIEDCSDRRIDQILAEIEALLPRYGDNWTRTTDGSFEIDTSKFSGTKYYTLWAKLEKEDGTTVYDAEIFQVQGTKIEKPQTPSILDPDDDIKISEIITDGKGTIEISKDIQNYDLYYQWVEIDKDTYDQIKKLKAELQIIQYFNMYDATEEDEYYDNYIEAQEAYKALYGEYLEDCSDAKIDQILSQLEKLLPPYANNWTQTTDNTFEIDPSTFTGTRYYTLWVKLEKEDGTTVYDAEVFEIVGTKQRRWR